MAAARIPKTKRELETFIGLANQFRDNIHHFATIMKPLDALNSAWPKGRGQKFPEGSPQRQAFLDIKQALVEMPRLWLPDTTRPFVVCK